MATTNGGIQKFADLKYFFSRETFVVLVGTIVVAVVELSLIPKNWRLYDFVTDWKLLVMIVAVALIILPPPITKGMLHLRSRDENAKNLAEMEIALSALHARTSHLISKVREVRDGVVTNAYARHSLSECKGYFEARRTVGGVSVEHSGVHVEVVYYQLSVKPGGSKLERKLSTSDEPLTVNNTISTRGGDAAKKLVERISAGEVLWVPDMTSGNSREALGIKADHIDNFAVALGVPVFQDKSINQEVKGMLLVTSSNQQALLESDAHMIKSYAWFLSVAGAIDTPAPPAI